MALMCGSHKPILRNLPLSIVPTSRHNAVASGRKNGIHGMNTISLATWSPSAISLVSKSRRATTLTAVTDGREYSSLDGISVIDCVSEESVNLQSLIEEPGSDSIVIVAFLSHFGDLTSWEFAQKLKQKVIPAIEETGGVQLVAVGLGSASSARKFSEALGFPLDKLYADPGGSSFKALGFSEGFGKDLDVNPYLKLLPMLMGIGSPGTIQEVLRGYVGDRNSKEVFSESTPFDILGKGYQRPFELATLRLFNMAGILPKWSELSPEDSKLLTQQGGTLVFKGAETVFRHDDAGILKYCDVDYLLESIQKLKSSPIDLA